MESCSIISINYSITTVKLEREENSIAVLSLMIEDKVSATRYFDKSKNEIHKNIMYLQN
jgi:hypothetical protein